MLKFTAFRIDIVCRGVVRALSVFLLLLVVSCATPIISPRVTLPENQEGRGLIKPVVAVTDFENKSGFSGAWNLGTGMADMIVTELIDSKRFTVLDRKRIGDVVGELKLQNNPLFRSEGQVSQGRLKNARYLIRGAVTDFTVTRDTSGWFGYDNSFRLWGRGQVAKVTLHAMVVEVESGEVIGSFKATGKASSGLFGAQADYKKLNFGGQTFFQTPLGKATEKAMENIVSKAIKSIPKQYWLPRVAEVNGTSIIVNGGDNVQIEVGDQFRIVGEGRIVTDPVTGDPIEYRKGPLKGGIVIDSVLESSSHGQLIGGTAHRGDLLEFVEP